MSNHLQVAMKQSITALCACGWSQRRIAQALRLDRATVRRHLALAAKAATNLPAGSAGPPEAKPATNPPTGSEALNGAISMGIPVAIGTASAVLAGAPIADPPVHSGPPSACEGYRPLIETKAQQGLSAQRIYQDLVEEVAFGHGYDSVKRFVRRLAVAAPLPFRRMECAPGEEAQVDFGRGAALVDAAGQRRGTWVFRIVLSHSRKGYSEAVLRQTTEDFLACLENAFWSWGGVVRTLIIDNLRAAVTQADRYEPELNPRVAAFCAHYGTVILPCRPYAARHKGKIERGIGYVKDNGLKGRTFTTLAKQNEYLRQWEETVADTRIHGTTRQQVGPLFLAVERPVLLALPAERLPYFQESLRSVHRDGHVEVAKAYYSVPPEYVTRQVWARWDAHTVRIFNQRREQIALHARRPAGRFATAPAHIHSAKIWGVERGAAYLLQRAALLGSHAAQWAQTMLQSRGVEGVRVLQGLLSLASRYSAGAIDQACQVAVSHQSYRLRAVRELLAHRGTVQESLPLLEAHPLIRPPEEYATLVRQAFHGTTATAADHPATGRTQANLQKGVVS
jgi:transposase